MIHRVATMEHSPGHCLVCNGTPTDDEGYVLPALNLDVEFDWGEQAYLCMDCARIVAGILGWEPVEKVNELKDRIRTLLHENKKQGKRIAKLEESRRRLLAGIQEVKAG